MSTSLPPQPHPSPRGLSLWPHQAIHGPVVGSHGEDDHVQAVDQEVEVEGALDESVPLVLQESVQRLHQEHVVAILGGAERSEAPPTAGPPRTPTPTPGAPHSHMAAQSSAQGAGETPGRSEPAGSQSLGLVPALPRLAEGPALSASVFPKVQ